MLEFLQCKGTKKEWIVSRLGLKKRVRSDVWTALFGYQGWLLTLFHFLEFYVVDVVFAGVACL